MKVAVIQPSYIPWLGYFYMINWADIFIFYDDVQYDKDGWRNRNQVMHMGKPKWLTLSIDKSSLSKDFSDRKINKVKLAKKNQFKEHKRLLKIYYSIDNESILDKIYTDNLNKFEYLSDAVIDQTINICKNIGIKTNFIKSSDLDYKNSLNSENAELRKNLNLLKLIQSVGGKEYISGKSAKNYLDTELFEKNGINIHWNNFNYTGKDANLSIIHYLIAEGDNKTIRYIS